jgi:hypothetical protein
VDNLWTIGTTALQEVDRQQQVDKVRISELETQLEQALESEKEKTETLKSRLVFLGTVVTSLIS